MFAAINSQQLFSENDFFAQAGVAGEFAFLAQDGRDSKGAACDPNMKGQRRTLENLEVGLKTAKLDLSSVVSLMVYLPRYEDADEVAQVLTAAFDNDSKNLRSRRSRRRLPGENGRDRDFKPRP